MQIVGVIAVNHKFAIMPLERHKITNPNISGVGYKIVDFIFGRECRLNLCPYRLIFLETFEPRRKEVYCRKGAKERLPQSWRALIATTRSWRR